jgi:hypothetical protein
MEKDIIDERDMSNSLYRERTAETYFLERGGAFHPRRQTPMRGSRVEVVRSWPWNGAGAGIES